MKLQPRMIWDVIDLWVYNYFLSSSNGSPCRTIGRGVKTNLIHNNYYIQHVNMSQRMTFPFYVCMCIVHWLFRENSPPSHRPLLIIINGIHHAYTLGFVFQLSTGKMFLFVSNVAVHILAKKCVLFNRYVAKIVDCCCYLLFIIKEPYS